MIFQDLTPKIISFLKGHVLLKDIIGDRIISPEFSIKGGGNEQNPKVAIRQIATQTDAKYAFIVRADTLRKSREIAIILMNIFHGEIVGFDGVQLADVQIDSQILDVPVEGTGEYDAMFYCTFIYF